LNSDPGKRQAIRITVSIGVAGLGPAIDTADKFLKDADRALYAAKSGGHDRTTISAEMLEKSTETREFNR